MDMGNIDIGNTTATPEEPIKPINEYTTDLVPTPVMTTPLQTPEVPSTPEPQPQPQQEEKKSRWGLGRKKKDKK
jgi:hypothetical protein